MGRRETIEALGSGQGHYTRSIIGKGYDAGHADGKSEGFSEGFEAANRYASKAYIACMLSALRKLYGFGVKRMEDVKQAVQNELLNSIDINETIAEIESMGVMLLDPLTDEE